MFRDSRGVVHTVSSADPLEDLPPGAVRALQTALLQPGTADLGGAASAATPYRAAPALAGRLLLRAPRRGRRRGGGPLGGRGGHVVRGRRGAVRDDEEDDEDELLLDAGLDQTEALDGFVDLTAPDEDDPRRLLPEELVTVLERELLLLPLRVRLEALVAAASSSAPGRPRRRPGEGPGPPGAVPRPAAGRARPRGARRPARRAARRRGAGHATSG